MLDYIWSNSRGVLTQSGFLTSRPERRFHQGNGTPGERCLPGRSENPVCSRQSGPGLQSPRSRRISCHQLGPPLPRPSPLSWVRHFLPASHGAPDPLPLRTVSGWCCSCQSRGKSGAHVSTSRVAPGRRDANIPPEITNVGQRFTPFVLGRVKDDTLPGRLLTFPTMTKWQQRLQFISNIYGAC